MSTLSVTTVNTANTTTDLTFTTGNTASGKVLVAAAGGIVLAGNSSSNVLTITATGVTINGTSAHTGAATFSNTTAYTGAATFSNTVTFASDIVPASSFKRNRIINGNMLIDQRNAGASVTIGSSAGTYTLDRWCAQSVNASKFSVQQNAGSVTPPTGFTKYLGVTSLAATSSGSTDYYGFFQAIEGFNTADLAWGTANAASVTISFWVRSSLTGSFSASLTNSGSNRSYPFSYTVNAANTWEQKTVTVAGDTSGTWLTDNSTGIYLRFDIGVGSTFRGTAGTWAAANYYGVTGAVSVVGTNGATFYVTGVQLEVGSVATPYERQMYSDQLAQCQRYFVSFGGTGYTGMNWASPQVSGSGGSGASVQFPIFMRAAPSLTVTGSGFYASDNSLGPISSTVSLNTSAISGAYLSYSHAAGLTSNAARRLYFADSTSYLQFAAEL